MSAYETERVTTIHAKVRDDTLRLTENRPYHARDGRLFVPVKVTVTVTRGGLQQGMCVVEVDGPALLKSGHPGQVWTCTKYNSDTRYTSYGLPLAEMPAWLSEFVAEATAGLLDVEVAP